MGKYDNAILDETFYNDEIISDKSRNSVLDHLVDDFKQGKTELQILKENNEWDILYHISPVRKNILEWYEFKKDASVLEIGAECGRLTDLLCKKVKQVTCIEVSKKKSLVNAERNKKYDNLKIYVGDYQNIVLEQQFDYVLLIGGLDKAPDYLDTNTPFHDLLVKIYGHLKTDGILLLATDNKFGLKYWAGDVEKHSGKPFEGIEGYMTSEEKERTFSKEELERLIKDAGYKKCTFYYPFPDYKFPQQIFSDDFLPKEDEIICSRDCFENDRIQLFDETNAYRNIIKAGKYDFFANSFFIEITKDK